MRKVILFALLSILALVGCGVQNHDVTQKGSSQQSDAAALQDEFTREFIDTSVEVEEGYLQFQSKIGGYTMLYPENAIADPMTYETSGETFELMKFGSEKNNNLSLLVYASYNKNKDTNEADLYLELLSSKYKYYGEYEKIELVDKNIYLATKKHNTKKNGLSSFSVLGFVQSKSSNQAVRYEYNQICYETEKGCNYKENDIINEALKLMESITFHTP